MKNNYYYTPVLVERNNTRQLLMFDFNNLSIAQLCEIKEAIITHAPHTKTIISLDKLIREKTENLMPHNKVYGKSYIKTYKENKKEQKMKKRIKSRRK